MARQYSHRCTTENLHDCQIVSQLSASHGSRFPLAFVVRAGNQGWPNDSGRLQTGLLGVALPFKLQKKGDPARPPRDAVRDSRPVRAIPWPSARWRARRRIDTVHAARLIGRESARGHIQPRCRGGAGVRRRKGCRCRNRSGGGPPASLDAHGRGRRSAAQRTCARRAGRLAHGRVGGTDRRATGRLEPRR